MPQLAFMHDGHNAHARTASCAPTQALRLGVSFAAASRPISFGTRVVVANSGFWYARPTQRVLSVLYRAVRMVKVGQEALLDGTDQANERCSTTVSLMASMRS